MHSGYNAMQACLHAVDCVVGEIKGPAFTTSVFNAATSSSEEHVMVSSGFRRMRNAKNVATPSQVVPAYQVIQSTGSAEIGFPIPYNGEFCEKLIDVKLSVAGSQLFSIPISEYVVSLRVLTSHPGVI
jgi:hypothetical protein